jgi:hypothetical protein
VNLWGNAGGVRVVNVGVEAEGIGAKLVLYRAGREVSRRYVDDAPGVSLVERRLKKMRIQVLYRRQRKVVAGEGRITQ